MRLWHVVTLGAVGCALIVASPSLLGFAEGVSVAPSVACPVSPAVCPTPSGIRGWVGYGISAPVGAAGITDVVGSWMEPNVTNFTCPAPNATNKSTWFASEAFGVGIDRIPQLGMGWRMYGVGTVGLCIFGVPQYYAWYEFPPALAVLLPAATITVSPGDVFFANVSCSAGSCAYFITDRTTGQGFTTGGSAPLATLTNAECVMMRGTNLGLPAPWFLHLAGPISPGAAAHAFPPQVLFGEFYTAPLGGGGCYAIVLGVPFTYFGSVLPPGFSNRQYLLYDPPPISPPFGPGWIVPSPLVGPNLDSFSIA